MNFPKKPLKKQHKKITITKTYTYGHLFKLTLHKKILFKYQLIDNFVSFQILIIVLIILKHSFISLKNSNRSKLAHSIHSIRTQNHSEIIPNLLRLSISRCD